MELEAKHAPDIIESAYKQAKAKLEKVESYLEEMKELDGLDDEWIAGKFQNVEECQKTLIEMKNQEAVGDEVFHDTHENVPTTGVNRIPKQNFKKPNELEENATLKDFEEWKSKLMD